MIDRLSPVLVANRGEIAVRVMATCRRLGIRTVAVYSDADAAALHVARADEAVRIGPPPASQSYLDQASILAAARRTGARSIHPGYGFLSENPRFAQRVIDAGLVWIGPPPAAMFALGDKARAKALAEQQAVPLLAGYHGEDQSLETLRAHADRIGYPVLIKASAGGGGRGMRVVDSPELFPEALEAARREALEYFGDARVLLERYVARPRHVEVQIIGDAQGHLVHLGERECSIQRRHQKLIEESPSPAVDAALRRRMGEAAVSLASAAGYANAGTVEFLLDQAAGELAFLEVNARLQVEHPVTEAVTGLDLIELQLRVAAGERLGLAQEQVRLDGHAIEARVIAEDPLAGFLPSSGLVTRFVRPRTDAVRVDSWLADGTLVSPYYDSLLAKVIAHAPSRREAVARLARALLELRITGVRDNVDLLVATLESPAFVRGDLHTGFLQEHRLVETLQEVPAEVVAAASALDFLHVSSRSGEVWQAAPAWRVGRVDQPSAWLRAGRRLDAAVSATADRDAVEVSVGAGHYLVRRLAGGRLEVDGAAVGVSDLEGARLVDWHGHGYRLERAGALAVDETAADQGGTGAAGGLTAPMPGRIVKIAVRPGESVRQNQPLVVLEAMKMEHVVEAPHPGVVGQVCVNEGDQVASGTRLLTLE